ncbi:MAG: hypothetical protein KUG82_01230 [Pseudomonadales bacterium]|nr:hypothetical protein [Pseudomonadales bacterium]
MQVSTFLLLSLFLLTISLKANSCNIYVAKDGDNSNPGTSTSPLLTIQAAASIATIPGDIVCVRPGLYYEGTQTPNFKTEKGVKILYSGTAENRIVFQADPNVFGRVIIDQDFDLTKDPEATTDPIATFGFIIEHQDYITIRGFEIRNTSTGIYTRALVQPSNDLYDVPNHIIIENNHIYNVMKDKRDSAYDSNIALIRPNDCYDCIIRGNKLHDVYIIELDGNHTYDNGNSAGIHSFGMLRAIIENNEIYNAHTGVFHKSWTNQPMPGNPDYPDSSKVPPPIDKQTDFGFKAMRNKIYDVILGFRISPSGGSGRIIYSNGKINSNMAHHNDEIFENILYSTGNSASRFGSAYTRAVNLLEVDLRGANEQSVGLKVYNNTVIAHNGVSIDAFTDIQIYNNFFSLSDTTDSAIQGPHVAIQTRYVKMRAEQILAGSNTLNIGSIESPLSVDTCIDNDINPDPDLTDNGGDYPTSTPPYSPDESTFFCDDNIQWTASISLSDYNYFHIPGATDSNSTFRMNRYAGTGNGVQASGIEELVDFTAWKAIIKFTPGDDTTTFGLDTDNPGAHSILSLLDTPYILYDVGIYPSQPADLGNDLVSQFLHSAVLNNLGKEGGTSIGDDLHIGAFPKGLFDSSSGPFSYYSLDTDDPVNTGLVGTPQFTAAPTGLTESSL